MPIQQRDYILRHIETIGRLLERLRRKGKFLAEDDRAAVNESLLVALNLQEKNFGMPATQFLALSADEQIAVLSQGESRAAGRERCLTYVTLLRDMAELYAHRGNTDLALGARQLALYVALAVALEPPATDKTAPTLVRDLLRILDGAELPPPTQELLGRFEALSK